MSQVLGDVCMVVGMVMCMVVGMVMVMSVGRGMAVCMGMVRVGMGRPPPPRTKPPGGKLNAWARRLVAGWLRVL